MGGVCLRGVDCGMGVIGGISVTDDDRAGSTDV